MSSPQGGTPRRVAKKGTAPSSARERRLFFNADGEEDKKLLNRSPAWRAGATHLISQNAEYALSPDEQFVAWTERYQAYVMPFTRAGRSVDIAPDGKALPLSRVSTDAGDWLHWAGHGQTLYWSQGPDLFAQNLGSPGAFAGGKTAPAPLYAHLGFSADAAKPNTTLALTGARISPCAATK